jgi:hypothetical protein
VQQETRTIPVIFVFVGDPVGSGFVKNVARPDGNLTGFPVFESAIAGKWLEIFTEVAPHVGRVAVILHPQTHAHVAFMQAAEAAAPPLKSNYRSVYRTPLTSSVGSRVRDEPNGNLVVLPTPSLLNIANSSWTGGAVSPSCVLSAAWLSAMAVDLFGTNVIDTFRLGIIPSHPQETPADTGSIPDEI